jgi:adenylyltransferase/sulfurtransferase
MALTAQQIERYSRQIVLPEIGGRGQQALLETSVALTGGALVAWVAPYLAAAGIGRVTVVAADHAGAAALCADLADLNPDGTYRFVTSSAAAPTDDWAAYDVLVATDPDAIPRLNAAAVAARRPLVAGAADSPGGWVAVFDPTASEPACAACAPLPGVAPPDPAVAHGVAVAAVIGAQMAVEVIRLRLGAPRRAAVVGRYDAATATLVRRPLTRNPACRVCGPNTDS